MMLREKVVNMFAVDFVVGGAACYRVGAPTSILKAKLFHTNGRTASLS